MKKIDFHIHPSKNISVEESAAFMREMCARLGYEGVGIMATVLNSAGAFPNGNEYAMELHRLLPGSTVFAALHHDRDFVEQAKEYMAAGFDGIKLLEGKPTQYRFYGYGFEHPRFDEFFAWAEKKQVPIVLHNNDPLVHWDREKISPSAFAKGWYYDEAMPTQEHFFRVLEDVLDRHPLLKMAIAHMGFYSNDLPRAEKLMEKCPNLCLDLTPALIIYHELSETPAETEAFFRKYHDRLIFGTDASSDLTGSARALNDKKILVTDCFFFGTESKDIGEWHIVPIHLEPYMLENIYYNNAMRFIGRL